MSDRLKKYLDGGELFDPDELTPVTSLGTMGDKLNSLVALCIKLNTEQRHTSATVRLLDDAMRAGHACVQTDTIATIERLARATNDTLIRCDERLGEVEREHHSARENRWKLFGASAGLIVFLLSTVGTGLFWLANLRSDFDAARAVWVDQVSQIDRLRENATKRETIDEQRAAELNMLGETVRAHLGGNQ